MFKVQLWKDILPSSFSKKKKQKKNFPFHSLPQICWMTLDNHFPCYPWVLSAFKCLWENFVAAEGFLWSGPIPAPHTATIFISNGCYSSLCLHQKFTGMALKKCPVRKLLGIVPKKEVCDTRLTSTSIGFQHLFLVGSSSPVQLLGLSWVRISIFSWCWILVLQVPSFFVPSLVTPFLQGKKLAETYPCPSCSAYGSS